MAILPVCGARLGLRADKLSERTSVIAKPKGLRQPCVIAKPKGLKQTSVIAKPKGLKQPPIQSANRRLGLASMLAQRRLRPTCAARPEKLALFD